MRIEFAASIILLLCSRMAYGQLSSTFYSTTCPNLLSTVKSAVKQAVNNEKRMGASLLRLHFHDCFVNGCDGSILLDDSASLTGEKTAQPNANSARGFDLGGPTWTVQLGRRDSKTASLSGANSNIPAPTSNLSTLISSFSNQGLSTKDMIVLSGAHTIGQARCTTFRTRVYNESNIDTTVANSLRSNCPSSSGDNNLSPLDLQTPTTFDNKYYKNLRSQKGLLHSDQQLFNGGSADSQVTTYSINKNTFFSDFSAAMVKMGAISPLTGSNGEIRTNCRKPN
ncbi:hypothetical protein KI387_023169, partial [Taxus chinensis]